MGESGWGGGGPAPRPIWLDSANIALGIQWDLDNKARLIKNEEIQKQIDILRIPELKPTETLSTTRSVDESSDRYQQLWKFYVGKTISGAGESGEYVKNDKFDTDSLPKLSKDFFSYLGKNYPEIDKEVPTKTSLPRAQRIQVLEGQKVLEQPHKYWAYSPITSQSSHGWMLYNEYKSNSNPDKSISDNSTYWFENPEARFEDYFAPPFPPVIMGRDNVGAEYYNDKIAKGLTEEKDPFKAAANDPAWSTKVHFTDADKNAMTTIGVKGMLEGKIAAIQRDVDRYNDMLRMAADAAARNPNHIGYVVLDGIYGNGVEEGVKQRVSDGESEIKSLKEILESFKDYKRGDPVSMTLARTSGLIGAKSGITTRSLTDIYNDMPELMKDPAAEKLQREKDVSEMESYKNKMSLIDIYGKDEIFHRPWKYMSVNDVKSTVPADDPNLSKIFVDVSKSPEIISTDDPNLSKIDPNRGKRNDLRPWIKKTHARKNSLKQRKNIVS